MAFNPVAEDTYDKFTGMRKRTSYPIKFGSALTAFHNKTHLTLGFIESGDSANLYIHILSDAAETWRFYSALWVLAGDQRYEFDLEPLTSNTYDDGYLRCEEQFSVQKISPDMLHTMLSAPRWEIRLSGRFQFETAIEEQSLDSWRAFYNAVVDPQSFQEAAAKATPSKSGCLVLLIAFGCTAVSLALYHAV